MTKPQIITASSGEQLVVLPLEDYEDIIDAVTARDALDDIKSGKELVLSSQEVSALRAAPTPLLFWRERAGRTQAEIAATIGVSERLLADVESGRVAGDIHLYARLASELNHPIERLVPRLK
jgi:DNA-binding XRE family transcriptional regulator